MAVVRKLKLFLRLARYYQWFFKGFEYQSIVLHELVNSYIKLTWARFEYIKVYW
jgi:hypothetical protein